MMLQSRRSEITRFVPEPGVVAGNRIAAGGDRVHYDALAMSLHWMTVLLVLTQFGLSQLWDFAGPDLSRQMIVAHMSFGILLAAVLALRIIWRLIPGHQVPTITAGWVELASKAVHYVLYGLLTSEVMLGFVLRWSGNEAMSFFGAQISPPFAPFSKSAHHLVGELHHWVGWTIIILAAGHAAAALFHQFVLHDGILGRMLPQRRNPDHCRLN